VYRKIYSVRMIHYREIYFSFFNVKNGILFGVNVLRAMTKYGEYCCLGYDAVYSGRNSSTFRLPPLLGPNILWKTNFHHLVHNSPSLDLVLSQMNPIHTMPSYSFKMLLDMIVVRLRAGRPEFYPRQGNKSIFTAQHLNRLLTPPSGHRGLYPRG
jgi:hypothetical protein